MAVKPLSTVRSEIIAGIYTNTTKAVTGDILQARMVDLLDSVGVRPWEKLMRFTHCEVIGSGNLVPIGGGFARRINASTATAAGLAIAGRYGVTGFATTAAASASHAAILSTAVIGGGALARELRLRTECAPHVGLFDGTNTGDLQIGFSNQAQNETLPTDAIYVRSRNGGNYTLVCMSGGVESVIDLGVAPVVGTYPTVELVINAAMTSVYAILNGAQSAPITTNIPTGTIGVWVGFTKTNAVSTAQAGLAVDYVAVFEP